MGNKAKDNIFTIVCHMLSKARKLTLMPLKNYSNKTDTESPKKKNRHMTQNEITEKKSLLLGSIDRLSRKYLVDFFKAHGIDFNRTFVGNATSVIQEMHNQILFGRHSLYIYLPYVLKVPIKVTFTEEEQNKMFNEFLSSIQLRSAYFKAHLKYGYSGKNTLNKTLGPLQIMYMRPSDRLIDEFNWMKANTLIKGGFKWGDAYMLWKYSYLEAALENLIENLQK